jgi:general secretion pathway protein L
MALTLGIDIGRHSIRGAVLRTSLRSQEVDRYLEVEISALDPSAPQQELVRSAIRELIAALPSPPDQVIVALDGTRGSLRTVEIPMLAKKRAYDVLPFELDALLPFEVETAVLDYQEVGPRGDKLQLLAAAVPETAIEEALDSLSLAGVSPRELAVGAAALDGLAPYLVQPPGEAYILVHLDSEQTDVIVLRDGICELARTLDVGSDALSARPEALRFALHQTLMKYRGDGGPLPTRLVVMGVGASEPGHVDFLGRALELEADALSLPAPQSAVGTTVSPVFGKALALASRTQRRGKRIDMRRGRFARPRGVSQLRDYALLASVCVAALLFSYVFRVWSEYRVLASERDALSEKLALVSEERLGERTTSVKRAKDLLESGGTRKDPLPRFDAYRAMAAVSAAVPEAVKHDTRELEIELDETGQTGKLHLEGLLIDLAARDQVAEAIEAHDCIEQLERGKTSVVPGEDRKKYTLDGAIGCPGAAPPTTKKGTQSNRSGRK